MAKPVTITPYIIFKKEEEEEKKEILCKCD